MLYVKRILLPTIKKIQNSFILNNHDTYKCRVKIIKIITRKKQKKKKIWINDTVLVWNSRKGTAEKRKNVDAQLSIRKQR